MRTEKLKTLKDIVWKLGVFEEEGLDKINPIYKALDEYKKDLRKEAIKWIKNDIKKYELQKLIKTAEIKGFDKNNTFGIVSDHVKEIDRRTALLFVCQLMYFFNITEEELK